MDESEDKGKVVLAVRHQGALCAACPKAFSSFQFLGALSSEDFTPEVPWRQCLFPGCNCPCPSLSLLMFAVGVTPTLQKALSCKVSLKMIHHQLPSVGGPTFGSGDMHALCPPHPNLSKHQPFSGKLLLHSILLLWVGTSVSSKSREHRSTSLVGCFPYPTIASSSALSVHAKQEKDLVQGLYPRSPAEG